MAKGKKWTKGVPAGRPDRSAERFFTELEDLALADVGDLQGVGSKQKGRPADGQIREATAP